MLQDWKSYYGSNLLIVLPDAFGTDAFLRDAPDWVADWTGFSSRFCARHRRAAKRSSPGGNRAAATREKLLIFRTGSMST